MGLNDRDYMRERRRAESKAARLGSASWIDAKGRLEHHDLWFDARNIGRDSRKRRYRRPPRVSLHPWQKWTFLLSAILILVPMYGAAKREGWIPDFAAASPFPDTGSVTVAASLNAGGIRSRLTVEAGAANAVVQFLDPLTDRHIFSVYVAKHQRVTVPAPIGAFRLRLIEGQRWHGTSRYFGPNTSYETAAELLTFEPRAGHIIDLNRRPDGNLKTRMMLSSPQGL